MIHPLVKGLLRPLSSNGSAAATRSTSTSIAHFSTTTSGRAPPPSCAGVAATHLIDTYDLSPDEALSISNLIHLRKTHRNPHELLSFLKDHGFTGTQIANAIAKRPLLLSLNPHKTLKRRWDFFHSHGLSAPIIANLLSAAPALFQILLRKNPTLPIKDINPNFETLRDFGIPDRHITRMLCTQPRSLLVTPDRFKAAVAEIKEMGFSPSEMKFSRAVSVICSQTEETLESKRAMYRSLGWSDHGILMAFRSQPTLFTISDETIKKKIDFFLNDFGLKPESLLANPVLLLYSLKKRLVPRYSVLKILMSRGLLTRNAITPSVLIISEKNFRTKYVEKYEKEVPEVVEASQSEI